MEQQKTLILIVDDNEVVVKTLSMKLKASGYEVVTAPDGSAAISSVRKQPPALILLDISFPPDVAHGGGVSWDGFQILGWLNRMEEAKNVPVIIITGSDSPRLKERAMASGAAAFFQKPVDNDELVAAVQKILGPRPQETTTAA